MQGGRVLKPDASGHAKALVESYGAIRALEIARVNRLVPKTAAYWSEVLRHACHLGYAAGRAPAPGLAPSPQDREGIPCNA